MKIAVIGATGFVGSSITNELVNRNHNVTAISRNIQSTTKYKTVKIDVSDSNQLANVLKNHDLVISAYNAGWENPNLYNEFIANSKAIQQAVKQANIGKFIVIGGAGSLYISKDIQIVDTPTFYKDYYVGASAARDYLNLLKEEQDLNWVFFSPALEMHQGITTGRTGNYRLGLDTPVFDDQGKSVLSVQDLAVVIADQAENPNFNKIRFTAAY